MTVSDQSTRLPSTSNGMPPITDRLKPVAATMMSASISSPLVVRTPFSVKRSIVSVTTVTLPDTAARKMSPSGQKASRCCQTR